MRDFYELCIRNNSADIAEKAEEIGWSLAVSDFNTVFLDAGDWGELKKKIRTEREKADVLVFKGGDERLNRKASGDSRVDVLLHPEKGRKDSGINHVVAEKAAENKVAVGLDLQQLKHEKKARSHILKHWRRNLMLCKKFGTPYIITSGAYEKYDLRAPRELASILNSLGYEGLKAVSDYPREILERAEKTSEKGFVRPGVEKKGGSQ